MPGIDDILGDVRAEYERLDNILDGLNVADWAAPSGAPGWSVLDVVIHLALTEELVAEAIAEGAPRWRDREEPLDDLVAANVRNNQGSPADVLARWRAATASSLAALVTADPDEHFSWAAAPLRPRTLATTRLAEHWAHALDIVEPLGIELPDTERLRHIAWLGHRTIPYGCGLHGIKPRRVRAELLGPNGESWVFGPADAESRIVGSAGEFCRVGAQRLAPGDTSLETSGPFGADALRVLRNYAA